MSMSATSHQVLSFFVMMREMVTSRLTNVTRRAARAVFTEMTDVEAVENLNILFVRLTQVLEFPTESSISRKSRGASNLHLSSLFV